MAVHRKSIDFEPGKAKDNLIAGGCSILASLIVLAVAILSAKPSIFDWIAFFLLMPPMVLLIFLVGYTTISEGLEGLKKNKKWRHETDVMETNIVDRKETYYEYDGYAEAYSMYEMTFSLVPDQQAICTGETVVIASVSQSIFQRYAHKKSARIYYFPADPLAFLIKGEI